MEKKQRGIGGSYAIDDVSGDAVLVGRTIEGGAMPEMADSAAHEEITLVQGDDDAITE